MSLGRFGVGNEVRDKALITRRNVEPLLIAKELVQDGEESVENMLKM